MMQKISLNWLTGENTAILHACEMLEKICMPAETWSYQSFLYTAESEHGMVLAALTELQVLAGFLTASCVLDTVDLTNIAVAPAYRRQGIGSYLLTELKKQIPQGSIFLEVRESNQPAIALYQEHDFIKIGIRKKFYQNPEEDAVLMQCKT